MSDLKVRIRAYYDSLIEPVNAAEAMTRRSAVHDQTLIDTSDIPEVGISQDGGRETMTTATGKTEQLTPPPDPRRSWRAAFVFGTALVLVLAAVGTVWLLRGATEPIAGPSIVFRWGDDLSEWVTEDEMTDMFEGMSMRYAGVDLGDETASQAPGFGADGMNWRVGPDDDPSWRLEVHNGSHIVDDGVVLLTTTDPRLPDGVTYGTGGWGVYTFLAPNSDESICMSMEPPREILGDPADDDGANDALYEEMLFTLASRTLREMGWAE